MFEAVQKKNLYMTGLFLTNSMSWPVVIWHLAIAQDIFMREEVQK